MPVDPSWVLALMLKSEPAAAASPWRADYPRVAAALARGASRLPLYAGPDGEERTAALLVSVAWHESRFRADAEGDHVGAGAARRPTSFCLLQVAESNFRALRTTREEVQGDLDACVGAGLRLMKVSFAVCRGRPPEHRLDHYAAGGDGCFEPRRREGEHRVARAVWLFRAVPPPPRRPTNGENPSARPEAGEGPEDLKGLKSDS